MTAPLTPAERETPAGEAMREAVAFAHERQSLTPLLPHMPGGADA